TIAGLFGGLLARLATRLRPLFPPEVTGLVVTMVGLQLVAVGAPRFLGFQAAGSDAQGPAIVVATATLAVMIGPTVWSRGRLRLYPVLLGPVVGYVLAHFLGVFHPDRLRQILAAPVFSLPPRAVASWSFDLRLLPAFLIVSLAATLKTVGDMTLCQKINDADWKRTDMKSVSGGI